MRRKIWRRFLTGLILVVPIVVVIFVLVWLFTGIDGLLQPGIEAIFGNEIPGLGFVITIILIYLAGLFTSNVVGHRLIHFGESLLARIPLLKQLYNGTKQVIASLSGTGLNKAAFREVVLVEFPREGMKTVAFVTNETKDEAGRKLLMIYIPTAPIPTSGYFEIVTEDKVTRSNLTVDEAMQMVISSGMVVPDMIDTKGTSDSKHEEKI